MKNMTCNVVRDVWLPRHEDPDVLYDQRRVKYLS